MLSKLECQEISEAFKRLDQPNLIHCSAGKGWSCAAAAYINLGACPVTEKRGGKSLCKPISACGRRCVLTIIRTTAAVSNNGGSVCESNLSRFGGVSERKVCEREPTGEILSAAKEPGILAEACASRTHRRQANLPPAGFEDRDSHRTACAPADETGLRVSRPSAGHTTLAVVRTSTSPQTAALSARSTH